MELKIWKTHGFLRKRSVECGLCMDRPFLSYLYMLINWGMSPKIEQPPKSDGSFIWFPIAETAMLVYFWAVHPILYPV